MRIVIVGGGSVGLLLAARLAQVHQLIHLIVRSKEQAENIKQNKITYQSIEGETRQVMVSAGTVSDGIPEADIYIITVKQPDIPDLIPSLHNIPCSARIIAFQNGLGHHEVLAATFHPSQTFYAVNTEGARRVTSTEVIHTGRGLVRIGPYQKQEEEDKSICDFSKLAIQAGLHVEMVDETVGFLWRKVIANAVINPLTTIYGITNGELLTHHAVVATMRILFEEARNVAEAEGQKIIEQDWQDILTICRNTSRNYSSMLQDLWNGKQTEIDSINGYISRTGTKHHIQTPMNDTVCRIVSAKTSLQLLRGEASYDFTK